MEAKRWQKTYIELLGVCCASEVPAVEKILNSLQGIKEYKVIVPTRTVIVVHDSLLISHLQIVNALNQARLEATVKVSGSTNFQKKWPSPYAMASGVLLALSLFKYVYSPLRWVALGSVAVGIVPLLLKGIASARKLRLDANILMLIAAVGTVCLGDYTEAGTIVFLFCIAEWLEARASYKAQAVMSSLMSIAPQKAVLAETGEQVDVDDVKPNTVIAVKAGEVIPIDGVVVDGMSEVDEKTLTGESFPVAKEKDSTVWAGTINLNGYVTVKTTALAEDCMVAKMTKLVEEAQNSKSATQRFVDRCAQYYTPAVVVISASLAVVPLMLRLHNRSHWFHLAVVVLVSACPCALILSTPVATFCALTKAATAGLLIKGGDYLETLAKIKVIAFDKTGTLTRGEFVVNNFETLFHDISSDTLLYWASSIESKSSHPMAAAVVDYAMSRSVDAKPENVEEFLNYPGEGIHGRIDGHSVYIGNRRIAVRAGSGTVPRIDAQMAKGQTIGFIYVQGRAVGVFSLSDVCRTGVKEALDNLKLLNIKSAMLTGDSQSAAMQTQEQLGHSLDEVYSELLPEDKATIVESLKKEGATAMVGDGINDAPALATADIGISMGISGSALATETGQVILMSNDIRKVPKAIKIARKAHRKVIENVVFSIIAKAGILALAFAGHPLIWAAVLADVGTCLLVIMNSMLLLRGTENYSGKCSKLSDALPGREDKNNQPSANCKKDCCAEDKVAKMFNVEDVGVSNSCCKSKLCRKNEYSDSGNFRVINNDMEANTLKCHEDANVSTFCCKSISCRKNEFSDPAERQEDRNEAWRSLKVDQCHSGSFQMVIDLEANHPKQQEDVPLSTSCCKSKSCKKNESSDSGKGHVDEIEVWRFDKVDSNTQSSGIRKRCCAEKRVAKLCNIEDVPATSSCCESKSGKNEFSDLPKRQQDQCHSGSFQMVNNYLLASNPKCHEDVPIGISCCKSNSCGKNESSSSAWRHQDQNVVDRSVKGDQCDSGSFQMVNCDPEANKPKPDDVPVSTSCCKNKSCKKDESSELAKRVKDQNKVCESEKDQCDGDNFQMLDLEANNPKLDGVPVSTSCCKTKSCRKNERSDSAKRYQNQKKACQSDKQKQCHYGDQHQHLDIHHVHPIDTLSYGESSKTITNNYRSSLEKTEIIGCCRIYLEECCSQLEQILNRGLGGGILEIITE